MPKNINIDAAFASDGNPAIVHASNVHYLGCYPTKSILRAYLRVIVDRYKLCVLPVPDTIRITQLDGIFVAQNYGGESGQVPLWPGGSAHFLVGGARIEARGVSAWVELA